MNNMYDIIAKMNLLEGKGSKPDFLDLDKDGNKSEPMKSAAKDVDEGSTGDYSAKKARAGKDIGKPGKMFSKIAKSAGEHYGSKERGEKVAGAVLAKLRAKESVEESDMEEGNAFTGKLKATAKGGEFELDGKKYKDTSSLEEKKEVKKSRSAGTAFDPEVAKSMFAHNDDHPRYDVKDTGYSKRYTRKVQDEPEADDEKSDTPKVKGRPKGSKRAIGAKGPTGKSKLLKKGAIKEMDGVPLVDKGEYDREGEMAKQQIHTIMRAAKRLHSMLGDDENLPEWVQKKITLAQNYIDGVSDYLASVQAERDEEMPIAEKAVSQQQQKFMGMAHAMQKGEKIKGASKELKKVAKTMKKGDVEDFAKTKHAGLPKKVKHSSKEVEETTVAGSVATAPATTKGAKGMIFGKGVYENKLQESFSSKLDKVLNEGMNISVNMSQDDSGNPTKNITVSAEGEDAEALANLLQMAGLKGMHGESCPTCGQQGCGCEQMDEATDELANSPDPEVETTDYMTNTLAGGLNKKKVTGMTTIPVVPTQKVTNEQVEIERNLFNLYKQFKV